MGQELFLSTILRLLTLRNRRFSSFERGESVPYAYALLVLLTFLCYCAGRFIQPVGEFYVSVILIPLGKLFLAIVERLQSFKEAHEVAHNKQPGLVVIVRLIALVFALGVVVGEGYSSLIAIPALFGSEADTIKLPFPELAVPAMALLFFSLCAMFGMLWLESSEYIIPEARLFDGPRAKSKGFRLFATTMLITSLIATVLYYVERKFFLLDPESDITTYLQLTVFLFMGILVPCGGAVALWIVAVGLQAVINILFSIATFVASIIVEILDFLCLHFTHRRMSIHNKDKAVRDSGQTDEGIDKVIPYSLEIGKNFMREETIGCYYVGPFGGKMQPIMEEKIRFLGAAEEIASSGVVNLYNPDEPLTAFGVNVSPNRTERDAIIAAANSDEEANVLLLRRLGEKLIDVHLPLRGIPALLLFFLDKEALTSSSEMLRMIKRQLKFQKIAIITMLDENDKEKEVVRKGLRELAELHEQGIIATTFVLSSRSPFAAAVKLNGGVVKQLEFVAQTLTSLLLARKHSKLNTSCVEVLCELQSLSSFITFAFASDRVAPVKSRGFWAFLLLLIGKKTTVVDKVNTRDQAEHNTRRVLVDAECRAIDNVIDLGKHAVLIYNIPLALNNKGFGYVQKELVKFLGRAFPSAEGLTVRGNGIPIHPAPLDPFYVQVSCLYPLVSEFFESTIPELASSTERAALPAPKATD
jgi:hypothetical protein